VRLDLQYRTEYRYDPPVREGITTLRLVPTSRPGLEVMSAALRVSPGRASLHHLDGWGTRVDLIELPGLHDRATFDVTASVETHIAERDIPPSALEWALYRLDSARVRLAAVEPLGWQVDSEGLAWAAVESALAWIPQRFVYRVGATDAGTPIEAFLNVGAGVCQDFSHLFLALLRRWGWCARYVSGYFFAAPDGHTEVEADATHAWIEVYRPGTGWIALDPTHGRYADERYVPISQGRDYDDVRPVRGVFAGSTTQVQSSRLTMRVQQQQQQVQ
jgi:transglutaminase-like putative cysteine protease